MPAHCLSPSLKATPGPWKPSERHTLYHNSKPESRHTHSLKECNTWQQHLPSKHPWPPTTLTTSSYHFTNSTRVTVDTGSGYLNCGISWKDVRAFPITSRHAGANPGRSCQLINVIVKLRRRKKQDSHRLLILHAHRTSSHTHCTPTRLHLTHPQRCHSLWLLVTHTHNPLCMRGRRVWCQPHDCPLSRAKNV